LKILIVWEGADTARWQEIMTGILGDVVFVTYPDIGDPADIDYALVWMPPLGLLRSLSNLKGIISIGAGASHILRDPDLPADVPILRLVDEVSVRDMCHFAAYWVLHFHRDFDTYQLAHESQTWKREPVVIPQNRTVGVLGLGSIGMKIAEFLHGLEFDVVGWSRSPKTSNIIACHSGEDGLDTVLGASDILINMLPATPETDSILNAGTFAKMKHGAAVINMGRGEAIVDADLIAALNCGQIRGAALDVFRREPLPSTDPYWGHPKVWITPHAAGPTNQDSAPIQIARNIQSLERGEHIEHTVNLETGY